MAIEKIQAIRGMNDILPTETFLWHQVEERIIHSLLQYGYQEIRFPYIESTQLFKRSIGEVTDIVEKEMYTFTDLNGDSLTLRPEGTAGCLRACLEHGLLYNQQQKLWYIGPMFRHEKPQKGRYRQFNQFGVEALGFSGPAIELELLSISYRLWKNLNVEKLFELQINTLGTRQERFEYRKHLIEYFKQCFDDLDKASQDRLEKNPLRILDSKHPKVQPLLKDAPQLLDFLGSESKKQFELVCEGLEQLEIPYIINPFMVRGLDYYEHTIFEWINNDLGSQATVCAGGRYDALISELGGDPSHAVGFAVGLERLILSIKTAEISLQTSEPPCLFLITSSEEGVIKEALLLAESIRNVKPDWVVLFNPNGGSFKSQFKKADKSKAQFALILGEDELRTKQISLKNLRYEGTQTSIARDALIPYLDDYFSKGTKKAESQ